GIRPIVDGRQGPMRLRDSLEDQVMAMAKSAKKLFEENLCYSDGTPVKVVIANHSIGRIPETTACAEQFKKENVAITLSVTPCWCYGAETMDQDPMTIKAVWGFNGTERPGAVYLAAVLATHAQKGLPAFGIYGHEVQDRDDVTKIPEDVQEKLLRFARSAVAVATMRGKSYLQIGSMCMGIGGSIISHEFIEEYLGMHVESVDEVEILRRMEEGIYNEEEYKKALAWTKEHCKEGRDDNPEYVDFLGEKRRIKFNKEEKEKQWEFTVKMYIIIKDLIMGNANLPEAFDEEKLGHNAICAGFQGQRQWTDHWPNCDYPEAVLNSSFDFEGKKEPIVLATENDVLNGISMLFMKLLTNRAQIFADVRTFWSIEATKRVTGYDLEGKAKENGGIIHLLNSGAACLDACGECTDKDGNAVMKKWWEVTEQDIKK
ncbi:MAG: L-fucose isomerase, partial [Clostridia bacterium]|nr:L-fucose isomerase [Clostridia bacterium]